MQKKRKEAFEGENFSHLIRFIGYRNGLFNIKKILLPCKIRRNNDAIPQRAI
jgi:hypothetical protein